MKIVPEVRKVLESQIRVNGAELELVGQLDRKIYVKVNEVLEALGGTWNRKAKRHIFDETIADRIERTLVAGEVTTEADEGFFPTPDALATRLAEFVVPDAEREKEHFVLEPSAGTGALVRALLARGPKVQVVGVEYNLQRLLKMQLSIANPNFTLAKEPDFMKFWSELPLTGICANPPFCKVGAGDHVDHLGKMLDLLPQTARLACVMPASLRFRNDRRYVAIRDRIAGRGGRIEDLPALSFQSSGTNVNTCLVFID